MTTIKPDTLFKEPDTVSINIYKVKFDTLKTLDSVFVFVHDTIYPYNLENAIYPLLIAKNMYLTPSFEYSFEYYYKNDTIIPTFYFPNMITDIVHKHGKDSIRIEYKTIYRDYWYTNEWVQGALFGISALTGYLLNDWAAK